MIVIGVDAHKRTHTLVALDAATGTDRGQTTIQASDVVLACSVRPRAGKATLRAMLDTTMSRTLRHSTARTSQRRR